jgi:hypothetical protein
MKKIAIAIIGILAALYLAAYRPWRTGGPGEKDSAGGLNVAQDSSHPAPGAPDVNQPVKNVQQPVKEVKHRVTNARGAKRHEKGVKPSMAGMRREVKHRGADLEVQVIERQAVEPLTIYVTLPTERVEVVSVESEGEFVETSVEPMYVEDVKVTSAWTPAHRVDVTVPAPQECFTPYAWVELSDP